jgi:hypothetical protein
MARRPRSSQPTRGTRPEFAVVACGGDVGTHLQRLLLAAALSSSRLSPFGGLSSVPRSTGKEAAGCLD